MNPDWADFEREWLSYARDNYPNGLGEVQREELEQAFKVGAVIAFQFMQRIARSGPELPAAERLQALLVALGSWVEGRRTLLDARATAAQAAVTREGLP